jgi:hypothetical protein
MQKASHKNQKNKEPCHQTTIQETNLQEVIPCSSLSAPASADVLAFRTFSVAAAFLAAIAALALGTS